MNCFPTICVDNFFDNPNEIRAFAESLEYKSCNELGGYWPGKRSQDLHITAPEYFNKFTLKVFALFYDYRKHKDIKWTVNTYFQIVEPSQYGGIDSAWIHQDKNYMAAGVVYLNEDINLECGTSVFKPKSPNHNVINQVERKDMFSSFDLSKIDLYKKALEENNDQFIETARFNNLYNRLVAYNGSQYHAASNYNNGVGKPRLTQVFFINSIDTDWFPIPSSKSITI
jgi:hypothetical protein